MKHTMCSKFHLLALAAAAAATAVSKILFKDENLSREFPKHLPLPGGCIILLEAPAQMFEMGKLRPRGMGPVPRCRTFPILSLSSYPGPPSRLPAMAKLSKLASNGTPMGEWAVGEAGVRQGYGGPGGSRRLPLAAHMPSHL